MILLTYWMFKLWSSMTEGKSKFYVEIGKMCLWLLIKNKKKTLHFYNYLFFIITITIKCLFKFPDLFIKQNSYF